METWKRFHEKELTHSMAHYLQAIASLTRGTLLDIREEELRALVPVATAGAERTLVDLIPMAGTMDEHGIRSVLTPAGRGVDAVLAPTAPVLFVITVGGIRLTPLELNKVQTLFMDLKSVTEGPASFQQIATLWSAVMSSHLVTPAAP